MESLKVPKVIWEENAGNDFALIDIASHIQSERGVPYSPTSRSFVELIRSAQRYGLIEGNWHPDVAKKKIALSILGRSIVAPTTSSDVNASMRTALETPEVFRNFLGSIDGKIIPQNRVCIDTLIQDYHLPRKDAEVCYKVIMENVQELGISQEQSQGKSWLRLEKLSTSMAQIQKVPPEEGEEETEKASEITTTQAPEKTPEEQIPRVFISHSKNKKILGQIKQMLEFGFFRLLGTYRLFSHCQLSGHERYSESKLPYCIIDQETRARDNDRRQMCQVWQGNYGQKVPYERRLDVRRGLYHMAYTPKNTQILTKIVP